MVDTKLTGLTPEITIADDELVYFVKTPATTPLSRKIAKSDLFKSLGTPLSGILTNCTGLPITGIVKGSAYQRIRTNPGATALEHFTEQAGIPFVIDGGDVIITTGIKGDLEIPFDCVVKSVRMLADQSGSIVVDIWKDTYANFPPTVVDSISAAAIPTIATAVKSEDTTLTGWTATFSKGDILRYNVDSITSIQRVTISLIVDKRG